MILREKLRTRRGEVMSKRIMNKNGRMTWGDNGLARIPSEDYKNNYDNIFRKSNSNDNKVARDKVPSDKPVLSPEDKVAKEE